MPSQDVIFFFTYVQPYGSPYYDHVDYANGIVKLEECVSKLQIIYNCSHIVVCGDLNSRTASVQPFDEFNNLLEYIAEYDFTQYDDSGDMCIYKRSSEDKLINN